jgi:hypothetical protein
VPAQRLPADGLHRGIATQPSLTVAGWLDCARAIRYDRRMRALLVATLLASLGGCYDDQCPAGTHLLGTGCVPDGDAAVIGPPPADLGLCPVGRPVGRCAIAGLVCQAPPPSRVSCTCRPADLMWSCCDGALASCGAVDGGNG